MNTTKASTLTAATKAVAKKIAKCGIHGFMCAAVAWLAVGALTANAASGTWLGNGNAWDQTAAWSGGTIADGTGFTANFTGVNITNDVSMALGANRTISTINFTDATTSSHNLTLTGNTLTLGATPSINVTQPDRTLTISSILAGTAGITKYGQGTLTLSGANSITGASTINGGTLVLDYATADNRKLPNNSTLALSGGTIVLKGGTATENFTSTSLNASTFFVRDGGTAKVNLNTLGGGWLSVLSFSHDSMATTDRTNVVGIIGAWFTVGDSWAANSTGAADGSIVKYTGASAFSSATSLDVNYELQGGDSPPANRLVNTLRIVSTANDQILNLGTFTVQTSNFTGTGSPAGTSGGLLYAGGANGNYTITGTTGGLRIRNQNGQGQLINVYTGTLTVDAIVGSGSSPLVKSGEGTLVLKKDNSYGSLFVYQGVVRLGHNNALESTCTVQNGAALELTNGVAVAAAASLNITGTGISNGGALRNVATTTSSYFGTITLGGAARINSDSGTLTLTNGVVTGGNTVTFGGAGNTTVSTAAISGSGGLVKDGAGTLSLNAVNTYSGATTVNSGTLAGTGTIAGAVTVGALGTIAPGTSVAPTGTLTVTSNCTIGNKLAIKVDGAQSSKLAVTGTLTISGATLDITEISPLSSDAVIIASYTTLTGTFATLNIPGNLVVDYNYLGLGQIALHKRVGTFISFF